MSRLTLVMITLLFAMPALPVLSQPNNDNLTVGDLLGGTLTPDSPALAALGITDQEITRPESPSALATSLLNGLDAEGNFQTGLAFDFAPYLLFKGADLTLGDYRKNTLRRQLSRVQLSAALAKGVTDDDEAARAALALGNGKDSSKKLTDLLTR